MSKNMTPEERKAWGAKMKAAREAKKAQKATPEEVADSRIEAQHANTTTEQLLKRIEELEKQRFFQQPTPLTRTIQKFSLNLSDYPDPRERLADEPRLAQKAFKQNFVLEWSIRPSRYDAKDGIHYSEPGFRMELWKRIEDPESGELTSEVALIQKVTCFEDPESAIFCAHQKGYNISSPEEKDYWDPQERSFLDEMRYLRLRDWLFEIFWPTPPTYPNQGNEKVFDNALRPVKVLEFSSREATPIDFSKL